MAMLMIVHLLLLGLFSLFAAFIDNLDVVIENCRDDGNHISLDHASADIFSSSNANVDNTLEGQIPFPHTHHILAPTLLENAYETLDASVNGENITDAG